MRWHFQTKLWLTDLYRFFYWQRHNSARIEVNSLRVKIINKGMLHSLAKSNTSLIFFVLFCFKSGIEEEN